MKYFVLFVLFLEIFSPISSLLQTDNVGITVVTSDASTATESFISFQEQSLSLKTLVDSRFKHLAASFQDQIDELKVKVNQLEAEKISDKNIAINTSHPHGLQKRQATVKIKQTPICLNKTAICTRYFPDHPDAISNRKKFGGLVKNISSSARSLCTLYFPDHPDAYTKQGNYSAILSTETAENPDSELIGGIQANSSALVTNEISKKADNKTIEEMRTNYSTLVANRTPNYTDNRAIGVVMQTPLDVHNKEDTLSAEVTNKAIQNPDKQIKGMPTSCKDLQLLGHQLKGFYSVKTKLPNQTSGKIETVYCDFQASTNLKGFETRIGVVDIKSSPVYFSVGIQQDFYGKPKEKIIFKKQVVNIGGGFDWENQWFRAPYPGTYFFSVSGSKASDVSKVEIAILLNGEPGKIGNALTSNPKQAFGGFFCQVSIKLNANDKVELKMLFGKVILLYFTGWMLEEDLPI